VPQNRSGRCGVERKILPLPGIEPHPSIPQPVTIATNIARLVGTDHCLSNILVASVVRSNWSRGPQGVLHHGNSVSHCLLEIVSSDFIIMI
jgi:hypothetical protein